MPRTFLLTLAVWCLGRGCYHHFIFDVSNSPDDERQ